VNTKSLPYIGINGLARNHGMGNMDLRFAGIAGLAAIAVVATGLASQARAADVVEGGANVLDPQPISQQRPAVDGLNFQLSGLTGAIGGYTNSMFMATIATPIPYFEQFGAQTDLAIGSFDSSYVSSAAALHLFWRDPSIGLLGIYGDWSYINPEHAGRVAFEGAWYNGRWSLDVMAGVQFGQHVYTDFVDEIDLSYYFTDNLKTSLGHRLTSRGNVGNFSFEWMPDNMPGWSVFGQAETGEDEYHAAWIGLRYAFGTGTSNTLIDRDRNASALVRIPRNIASVTRCGEVPELIEGDWWSHTLKHELCADEAELKRLNADMVKK
jgi:hypothetical protein